jgi:cell division protease FtsH
MNFTRIIFQMQFCLLIFFESFGISSCSTSFPIREIIKYKNVLYPKPFGQLYQDIENHKIDSVYFSSDLKDIYSKLHHDSSIDQDIGEKIGENDFNDETPASIFNEYVITNSNPLLANQIVEVSNKNKVETTILVDPVNPYNSFASGLNLVVSTFDSLFLPGLFIITAISIFNSLRNGGNSGSTPFLPMGLGNRNVKNDKINMQKANISLNSWAGSPEIFQECFEVVSYLKNSSVYKDAGAEIPKGILLEGPPGTGKTLIAKAIASEADANFISISASEFVEIFVGMGAAKVRNLFEQARQNTPCIVFIDEIDAVGRQRGAGINMGNDEREQTLNQLLAEMDGFAQNQDVLVIAATNRRDVLDAALLRPGRFDRIINVPLPDRSSRKAILKVHLQNKLINEAMNLDLLAEMTPGFSGAQLKNLINEAAINAARNERTTILQEDIENALEKMIVGIVKKNDTRKEDVLKRVAIHEMGHGFLATLFSEYFELKKITIQSTYNGAGGYTLFNEYPEISESGLYTKELLLKRLVISLGGKAAEYVFYGENHVSVGAMQDLKQANSLAQRMVGNYGMGNELKVFYNENMDDGRNPFLGRSLSVGDKYSDKTKEIFDQEALDLINEAYQEAIQLIRENKYVFEDLVKVLLTNVTLDGSFVNQYVGNQSVIII